MRALALFSNPYPYPSPEPEPLTPNPNPDPSPTPNHNQVRSMLCELPGVGPKVADCVALFSLDQAGTVPVDTHVWQIACRDLDPTLSECKSLTPAVYERVGLLFL